MMHAVHGVHAPSYGSTGFAHPTRNTRALQIQPGMRIADFGAGSGFYVFAIAEELANSGAVYAVDVQKELLRRISRTAQKEGLKNVHVLVADLEKQKSTKLADGTLDLVLMSNILFQLNDKRAALEEARRILKSSGALAVIDWSESFGGMGPQPKAVFSKDAAQKLLSESGFTLSRTFDAGAHHYGLILKKTV